MGQNSARIFPPPQAYGQANVNLTSEVTPQGISAPTVLLPDQAGGIPTLNPATPAPKVNTRPVVQGGGGGKKKLPGDDLNYGKFFG